MSTLYIDFVSEFFDSKIKRTIDCSGENSKLDIFVSDFYNVSLYNSNNYSVK